MNELYWRAVMDDGTIYEWEKEITLPDGSTKPASIDDIDRSKLSNLLTVTAAGEVVHSLGFLPTERATKKAVWRLTRKIVVESDIPVTAGALSGYSTLLSGGGIDLKLDFIDVNGLVSSGQGLSCELHPREVFTAAEAKAIQDEQDKQNSLTEADNYLLAHPVEEPLT